MSDRSSSLIRNVKSTAKKTSAAVVTAIGRTRVGRHVYRSVVESAMSNTRQVESGGLELRFAAPNALADWRAATLFTKEPETIEWIDAMPAGSVLWDVGANVGLYTCYAAAVKGLTVIAFEPSVFNLELLARNVSLNGVGDRVTIAPVALSARTGINALHLTSTDWGAALSTFGEGYGHDGSPLRTVFEFTTIGLAMDDAISFLGLPAPSHVKIDVDGIEHLILRGASAVLRTVQSVLIEVNDSFDAQATGCHELLTAAGLRLVAKQHSESVERSEFRTAYNQIWRRHVGS